MKNLIKTLPFLLMSGLVWAQVNPRIEYVDQFKSSNGQVTIQMPSQSGTLQTSSSPLNPNVVIVTNGSGVLTQSAVSATTLSFLDVTSSAQTQINSKQPNGPYITQLNGDVNAVGPGSVTSTVTSVGGVTAANVAIGVNQALTSTPNNLSGYIVQRDGGGNFQAGVIQAQISGSASLNWNITGNAGTNTTTNFVGTTDSNDFVIKANSLEVMRAKATGVYGTQVSMPITITNSINVNTTASASQLNTGTINTPGLIIAGAFNQNQNPTGSTFGAQFLLNNNPAATWANGSRSAAINGTLSVNGSFLKITNNNAWVSFSGTSNTDMTGDLTVRFIVVPQYSGTPTAGGGIGPIFFDTGGKQNTSINEVLIYHASSNGNLACDTSNFTGSGQVSLAAAWNPVSGTSYEIECDISILGTSRLFINGTQVSSVTNGSYVRSPNYSAFFAVGTDTFGDNNPNHFWLTNLVVFNGVQHTANFTGELPHVYNGTQQANLLMFQDSNQNNYAKFDRVGNLTVPSIVVTSGTPTTVPYFDAGDNLISSTITPTQLGYLADVTDFIQKQLNTKAVTFSAATPLSITSTNFAGVSSTPARIDHTHAGLHSVAVNGQAQLLKDVSITATGINLIQGAQIITMNAGVQTQVTATPQRFIYGTFNPSSQTIINTGTNDYTVGGNANAVTITFNPPLSSASYMASCDTQNAVGGVCTCYPSSESASGLTFLFTSAVGVNCLSAPTQADFTIMGTK